MQDSQNVQATHIERLADVIALPIGRWDKAARLVYCNAPYLAWSGRSREGLLGHTLEELYGPGAWAAAQPAFETAFGGQISSYERLLTHQPLPQRWARVQVFPDADAKGAVASVFTIATDIHEDVVARDALIAARKRLDRFTENIPSPLTYLDRECVLRFVNKAWSALTGIPAEQALGRHVSEVRGVASWLEQKPYYEKALAGEAVHFSRLVDALVEGPRWLRTSYVPDLDEAGVVTGVYTITTDVHDLTVTQEKLRRSVERDALTDALSRHAMLSFIEGSIADPALEYALFFIDLDGFKTVNDEKGHHMGDKMLADVARALRAAVRSEDAVGRYGGDEFLVLARVNGLVGAETLAEHLRVAVKAVAEAAGDQVSASIGYALAPHDTRDSMQLLHHADEAMYIAKRQGKNRAMPWSRVRA